MKYLSKLRSILSAVVFAAVGLSHAAETSCYPDSMRSAGGVPVITQDNVIVVDTTTPQHLDSQRALRQQTEQLLRTGAKRITLMTFAGNATGQALKALDKWTVEDFISDEKVIQETVIGIFKRSQKCVQASREKTRLEVLASLDKVLATLPIKADRSEIFYSLNAVIHALVKPNNSTLLLVLSDGINHNENRTFYAAGGTAPKKLNVDGELAYALKVTPPISKPPASYLSVVWLGMLSLAPPTKPNEKPLYLDASLIQGYVEFWTAFLKKNGNADKVQIGVQTVFSPDLTLPSSTRNPQ